MGRQSKPGVIVNVKPVAPVIKYRAMRADGAQVATAGDVFIGLSTKDMALGTFDVPVVISGTGTAEAASAFPANTLLMSDSQGRMTPAPMMVVAPGAVAVTSTAANGAGTLTGSATPQYAGCIALEASAGAGDFIEVKVL